jgi:hypothetical protein
VDLTLESIGTVEVTATVGSLTPVVFTETSIVGSPNHLVIVSGEGQSATVSTQLAAPFVIRLEDAWDNPVEGATLHFEPGATSGTLGSVTDTDVVTSSAGVASTTFTLGTLAGSTAQWVTVTVDSFPSVPAVNFYADADPDEPTTVSIVSGDEQSASYGQTLGDLLVAHVEDQYSNPVWDYVVDWSSTTGGSVIPDPSLTDAGGDTSVIATLGSTFGEVDQYFTATAGTADVTFHATATSHWIESTIPGRVWPGYPDPGDPNPELTDIALTLRGGGFETGAEVIWDVGGADEVLTPDTITETEIVVQVSADHFTAAGTYPIAVENPGPVTCDPADFVVGYLIPDTGQTDLQCAIFDLVWQWADCATIPPGDPLYGQDGHYQRPPRQVHFTDNGDDTVTDDLTGLMWQKTFGGEMSQASAITYCDTLTTGGYDDWRVPEIQELVTITNLSRRYPSTYTTVFPGVPNDRFWSSTENVASTYQAWHVYFGDGGVAVDGKTVTYIRVRCVRLGPMQHGPYSAQTIVGDPVVVDAATGLMWQDNQVNSSPWEASTEYCNDLYWAGFDDWRLPDRNELVSMVDYTVHSPALDPAFANITGSNFWSSTSTAETPANAWKTSLTSGDSTQNFKDYNAVLCVRLGP